MRAKNTQKHSPFPPVETENFFFLTLPREESLTTWLTVQLFELLRYTVADDLNSWLGYHPEPNNGIRTFKSAVSIMSGNGSYKLRNSENGVDQVGRCRMITRFHFALEIRGSARYLSGIKDYSPAGEESSDDSSLVMDRLCDRARGQNTAVGWFYFEFPGRKEHSATSMLGSFLKHDGFLAEWNGFWGQEQRRAISGCGPQLVVCCTRVRYLYGTMLGYIDDDQKIGSPRCRYRKFHRYPLGGLKH